MMGGESVEAFLTNIDALADVIVFVAAVVSALYVIFKPILQAKGFFQKKEEQKFKEQFKKEFNTCAPDFSKQVELLYEIKSLTESQKSTVATLATGIKNIQRQQIMMIYNDNKHDRTLEETEKERLDELYSDYKAEGGNSFIDKYYHRMCNWTIISDEE
jgi:hypothetical protein